MKNLLYILISILLMSFFTSCTADELPSKNNTVQTDSIDPNNPKDGQTDPPIIYVPPTKKL